MLKLTDLTVSAGSTELVHPLSFTIEPGQRVGLIGESGSGKSLTALAIMGLLAPSLTVSGSIELDGTEIVGLRDRQMRPLRGTKVAMIFQEPMSALDPLMTIEKQLAYAGATRDALADVDLDPALARRYPHQLSGGQRQRVMIAMAMAREPELLICDEPTTALDATTQDGVLSLIERLAEEHGTALLFISHDLRVVTRMCPEVLVLEKGRLVEHGPTEQILSAPQHEYTRRLVAASLPGAPAAPGEKGNPVIALDGVTKTFAGTAALTDVSLTVARGERLGLVGGSGSGKTTLLKLIAGLDSPTSGTVDVAGRVQMVFQDPAGSLNPRLPIWKSVREPAPRATRADIARTLEEVGIPADALDRYPHEFSGGQRQRISIARALIGEPDILLADEAVSALDVSVRATILELLNSLVEARGLTLVFVTHDLAVMRHLCSSIAVVSHGKLVDAGATEDVLAHPTTDYTRRLIAAAELS
ncbi:ABC transporter ATP-binding protein [uncultured Corynebacterium sp.]|uniref:ATP-binding cassette domain-containing protein n=1 Tax=uncultured Corynebacterium sp. TaxID=159447 RepID=UPI0025EEC593|nr:ABC transporter ATP-binding protein [uncultured Corynebacterium sp.]